MFVAHFMQKLEDFRTGNRSCKSTVLIFNHFPRSEISQLYDSETRRNIKFLTKYVRYLSEKLNSPEVTYTAAGLRINHHRPS
jgi:hypothetical protein